MGSSEAQKVPGERIGRYAIFDEIARGGMARVHLGRLMGPEGFSRVVAVKRLHPELLADEEFHRMFVAEARLAARVRHPNVVPLLDVLISSGELMIVMDYVHGESLHTLHSLVRAGQSTIPKPIVSAIVVAVLQGLHAAHEARDEQARALNIVHCDVSPQNVLVGADGVARVLDFGIAKAVQVHELHPESLKGKCSYMSPEVLRRAPVTRRADIFSASVVLWELLTGRKLFRGTTDHQRMTAVLRGNYPRPSQFDPNIEGALDRIVMRGLARDPADRFPSALDMAIAIERALPPASQRLVGEWVATLAAKTLETRSALIFRIETSAVLPARPLITPTNFSLPGHPTESAAAMSEPLEGAPSRTRMFTRQRALMLSVALALGATLSVLSRATRVRTDGPRMTAAEPARLGSLAQQPSPASAAPSGAPLDEILPPDPRAVAPAPSGTTRTKSPPSEAMSATSKVPALSSKSRARAKDFMPDEL